MALLHHDMAKFKFHTSELHAVAPLPLPLWNHLKMESNAWPCGGQWRRPAGPITPARTKSLTLPNLKPFTKWVEVTPRGALHATI